MKVVINTCYGGFGLSQEALNLIKAQNSILVESYEDSYTGLDKLDLINQNEKDTRSNPIVVEVVEVLGSQKASDVHAELKVIDVKEKHWSIRDYDGLESIVASNSPIVHYW